MSKTSELVRVEVVSTTSPHLREETPVSHMNIYVDTKFNIKVGDTITLVDSENPKEFWTIVAIHETVNRSDIKHGWNNNI